MTERKKILILSLAYHPFMGGAEQAIKEITDRTPDIAFHMITLRFDRNSPRREHIDAIEVHRVGWGRSGASVSSTFSPLFYLSKMLFVPFAAICAVRLNRREHFDAVWAMMTYMLLPVVLMRVSGSRLPYALSLQEGDTFERTFRRLRIIFFMPLIRFAAQRAAVVQAISTYLAEWPRTLGYQGSVEVIPNGVDIARFAETSSATARASLRTRLGLAPHDVLLITTSRLVPKNGIDTCIRALALLPSHLHLVVLGDGPERTVLAVLATELGVTSRVHFLGTVANERLPAYLHTADIFVRPSRSEGMGISFVETMAAGVPVIATQIGGIADFLFDRERNPDREPTGFAVAVDDPAGIAEKIRWIQEHPEETARTVENAMRMVRRKYNWELLAREMNERVFSKLLS